MKTPSFAAQRPGSGPLAATFFSCLILSGCTAEHLAVIGGVTGGALGREHADKLGLTAEQGVLVGTTAGAALGALAFEISTREATPEEIQQAESKVEVIRKQRAEQGLEEKGEALVRLDETTFIKIDLEDGTVADTAYEVSEEDGQQIQDLQAISIEGEELVVYS